MNKNRYFLEIWLRGYAEDYAKEKRVQISEFYFQDISKKYCPHITLIPPFSCSDEKNLIATIEKKCMEIDLLSFSLFGWGVFENRENFLHLKTNIDPAINHFRHNLHQNLDSFILCEAQNKSIETFEPHVTIAQSTDSNILNIPNWYNPAFKSIEQYMLRVTLLKNKRIVCEYDFARKELLTREQALDKKEWGITMDAFTKRTGLISSNDGFIKSF
jgi:2'-5' RNA ligase